MTERAASLDRQESGAGRSQDSLGQPYITLEDHLHILDTPEKIVPKPKEQAGYIMEFLPSDNTVIQVNRHLNRR